MPIFGQVWLWSLLAFLLGALLCWLLVARPARTRVGELEAQLTTRARRQSMPSMPERPEPDRRRDENAFVPGLGDRDEEDFRSRAYGGLPDTPPLPPERGRLAPYADQEPNREFAPVPQVGPPPEPYSAPPEPEAELAAPAELVSPTSAATQYLDVSSGSLSAPPEVPPMSQPDSDRGWFDDELEGDEANQGPEEQAAVPRNRHQLIEEPYDGRLVDDDVDETSISSALDDEPRSAIEDDGGTVFTQRTHPIPGELIRQIDEAGKEEFARAESDNLVDDLAEEPGDHVARRDRTVEAEAVEPPGFTEPESSDRFFTEPESSNGFTEPESSDRVAAATPADGFTEPESSDRFFTEPESSNGFTEPESSGRFAAAESNGGFTEPESSGRFAAVGESSGRFAKPEPSDRFAAFGESDRAVYPPEPAEQTEIVSSAVAPVEEKQKEATRTGSDLPKRVPQTNRISQGVSVRVEPTPNALPKRVPSKPRHQIPFGVQPSSTPEAVATATEDQPADPPRSLFEPIIPANDEGQATPPPPHRLRQGSGGGRGPFGPGSAMPLPGGASPSPDFTIKASVAALRYCTPESPQFGRTVAEVWFRTAADAERVGFRPVG
jgi:hypothetical protein